MTKGETDMTDFMEPQVTYFTRWFEITGNEGITFVEMDTVYPDRNQRSFDPPKSDVLPFYNGSEIRSTRIVDGYGARFSAPGYLDCTEWTVFETKEQAQSFLKEERS